MADSGGKALITTAETPVQVPAGGGVLKGQLDLSGLPPGQYTMVASLALAGRTVERSASFTMAGLDETLEKDVTRREAAKVTDAGYFDAMDEGALNTAREPLDLIAESGEMKKWSKDLSLRAKRRFLTEFWQRRDPTPETAGERAPAALLRGGGLRRQELRREGPGGAGRDGRRTAGGSTSATAPPRSCSTGSRPGRSPPYQVWRYRRGRIAGTSSPTARTGWGTTSS